MLLDADKRRHVGLRDHPADAPGGEADDVDYHFVDEAEFEAMVEAGEFAEWATVFDHRYGTPKAPVRSALEAGCDILFDIDWQGTQQLKAAMGDDLVAIFILPPTMEELERRLVARGTDSNEVIAEPHAPRGQGNRPLGRI